MDEKVTRELIAARNAVKEKYLNLKREQISQGIERREALSPIIEPLNKLLAQPKFEIKSEARPISPIVQSTPHIKSLKVPSSRKKFSGRKSLFPKLRKGITQSFEVTPTSTPDQYQSKRVIKLDGHQNRPKTVLFQTEGEEPTILEGDDANAFFEEDEINLSLQNPIEENVILFPQPIAEETNQTDPFIVKFDGLPRKYLKWRLSNFLASDNTYGVRPSEREVGKYEIGSDLINFDGDNIVFSDGDVVKGTEGLYELLFKARPDFNKTTDADIKRYKAILMKTNAHKQNYDSAKKINSNKGVKYTKVIAKLFPSKKRVEKAPVAGTGLRYWDDPNELVERLKLLIASQSAGNNNHRNEIISIVEELVEAGYIEPQVQ